MWKQIFKMVVIAGSLDIGAAFAHAYFTNGASPGTVLRYIASGWFGKEAFSGSSFYLLFGLFIHFMIVFACTIAYFQLYPKLKFLRKNIWLSAFLLALVTWAVTTRIIIPLSRIETPPFNFSKAIVAVSILFFCVGIPIAYFTDKYHLRISAA